MTVMKGKTYHYAILCELHQYCLTEYTLQIQS